MDFTQIQDVSQSLYGIAGNENKKLAVGWYENSTAIGAYFSTDNFNSYTKNKVADYPSGFTAGNVFYFSELEIFVICTQDFIATSTDGTTFKKNIYNLSLTFNKAFCFRGGIYVVTSSASGGFFYIAVSTDGGTTFNLKEIKTTDLDNPTHVTSATPYGYEKNGEIHFILWHENDVYSGDNFETYSVENIFLMSKVIFVDSQYIIETDNTTLYKINRITSQTEIQTPFPSRYGTLFQFNDFFFGNWADSFGAAQTLKIIKNDCMTIIDTGNSFNDIVFDGANLLGIRGTKIYHTSLNFDDLQVNENSHLCLTSQKGITYRLLKSNGIHNQLNYVTNKGNCEKIAFARKGSAFDTGLVFIPERRFYDDLLTVAESDNSAVHIAGVKIST